MDDIRRPQPQDYDRPSGQPVYQPPAPAPVYNQPASPYQPAAQPVQTPQAPYIPQPAYQRPEPAPMPAGRRTGRKLGGKKLSLAAGAILTAAAIFGAGWLLKGTGSSQTIPQSITRQVNYNLYFPSPMPAGFIYMKDTATFQIGQVYYKFASGNKRVTVNEQPMPQKRPDLSLMSGYRIYDSPLGKAAIGTSLGQTTAVVLTKTTVITMNTVGGVSVQELQTAINNLKLIGQNPQKT
jgi:hypothetical protein